MLISSPRHTKADLAAWEQWEATDAIYPASRLTALSERALQEMASFARRGAVYVGVSWGKDSVVVANLARTLDLDLELVWVRIEPIKNPDCIRVRDAFVSTRALKYSEIVEWCRLDGVWHASGTLERGFARAPADHYISGIRGEESATRGRRVNAGLSTLRTCAPIGHWTSADVFAYLYQHRLPVHPAYACSFGGMLDRGRIRVASLGGQRGTGKGREEWERRYYGAELRAIEHGLTP